MDFAGRKIFFAPMAGISDTVFRGICRQCGADVVVSEMVSAEGVFYKARNTRDLVEFKPHERPIGIQIFGSNPSKIAYAAHYIEQEYQPDFIDLNCGCPVPKVVKKNGGSALLRDELLFTEIIRAMVKAVSTPVTVKLRSGWTVSEFVDIRFARIAQNEGVSAIFMHPRSKSMGFSGHSLWERIGEVKNAVSIPVIGNGDIHCGEDAQVMFEQTGCDSVMIGRAALGNPWIFSQVKNHLRELNAQKVTPEQRIATITEHIRLFKEAYGERRAVSEMKKHVVWYIKGLPQAAQLRNGIFRAQTLTELQEKTNAAFQGQ